MRLDIVFSAVYPCLLLSKCKDESRTDPIPDFIFLFNRGTQRLAINLNRLLCYPVPVVFTSRSRSKKAKEVRKCNRPKQDRPGLFFRLWSPSQSLLEGKYLLSFQQ